MGWIQIPTRRRRPRRGVRQGQRPHQHDGELPELGEAATSWHVHQRGTVPYHLFRCLDEQSFRYNGCKLTDAERFAFGCSQIGAVA